MEGMPRGGKRIKGALFTILISGLTFPFMTQLGHALLPLPENIFRMTVGNGFLGWYLLLIIVMIVTGIIKANKKFHTILLSLVLGSIAFGVFSFLGNLIPFTRPYVQAMMQNAWLAIGLDVLGLVIASLFLISDFHVIDTCVQEGYPKEYEWYAAFGLVFTVLWIYLKILDLLVRLTGKSKE